MCGMFCLHTHLLFRSMLLCEQQEMCVIWLSGNNDGFVVNRINILFTSLLQLVTHVLPVLKSLQ
jgi:hypothetical protein